MLDSSRNFFCVLDGHAVHWFVNEEDFSLGIRDPFRSVPIGAVKALVVQPAPTASSMAHDDANAGLCEFGHFNIHISGNRAIRLCAKSAEVRDNWIEQLCRASGAPIADVEQLPAPRKTKPVDWQTEKQHGNGFQTEWVAPGWNQDNEFFPERWQKHGMGYNPPIQRSPPEVAQRYLPHEHTPKVPHLPAAAVPYELTSVLPIFPSSSRSREETVPYVGSGLTRHPPEGPRHPDEVTRFSAERPRPEDFPPQRHPRVAAPPRPERHRDPAWAPVPLPGIDNDTACGSPPVVCARPYCQFENWADWAAKPEGRKAPYSYAESVPVAVRPTGHEVFHRHPQASPTAPRVFAGSIENLHASRMPRGGGGVPAA